jgi:hypothetical protein
MVRDIVFCSLYLSNPKLVRTWIKYHHSIGVNHFYLFTLGKDVDYMIKPLEDLSDIVTIINWPPVPYPGEETLTSDPNGLFGHWAELCMQYYMAMIGVGKCEWIGNVDPDEFLVLEKDNTVINFLDRYKDKKYIKLKWNYAKMEGMTYKEYLNFDLNDFFKYDITINKNGPEFDNFMSSGYGKYFFKPQFEINIGSVHQPIEKPDFKHGTVEEDEYELIDEKIGSLYHFRYDRSNNWFELPQGFGQSYEASANFPDFNDSTYKRKINWDKRILYPSALTKDKGKLIIYNRIRELIEENKND